VFVEAASLGGFTRAGKKLGMSQPSVSRFINNLEAHTGLKLFFRNNNQIELTSDGQKLLEAASLGLEHISQTLSILRRNAADSTVTIGCTHGFSHMWLQVRLAEIQKLLPQQNVQIVTADHTVTLTHEDVSCAVRFGDGNWSDCDSRFLFSEVVFPVCSAEFAHNNNITDAHALTPDLLRELPLIVQDTGNYGWLSWREWFYNHGLSYEFAPNAKPINNYAFTLQAAMGGEGVALVWEGLDSPYLSKHWLVELGQLRVRTGNAYYLTFPKNSAFPDDIFPAAADQEGGIGFP
jgi:DNA-binding transcriptional LysR family regulator